MCAPDPLVDNAASGRSGQPASAPLGARLSLRPACADDQAAIVQLVRSERLNPHDLHWMRFFVATVDDVVAGAVQMRQHADGSLELGSLVVRPDQRGQELGDHLIARLLEAYPYAVIHVITRQALARRFQRWGFKPVSRRDAPYAIRRNQALGQLFGGLAAICRGRMPARLVILRRA